MKNHIKEITGFYTLIFISLIILKSFKLIFIPWGSLMMLIIFGPTSIIIGIILYIILKSYIEVVYKEVKKINRDKKNKNKFK